MNDPILERRARIAHWCATAKRAGYVLILIAFVVFFIGFATSFSPAVVIIVVTAIALSGVLLIPALIFGYGVKAAEREERAPQ